MDNVVLVGFSCSGKTTVGRMLARRLGLTFVDTDKQVERTSGRTISEIFHTDGEAAFRGLERQVVAATCEGQLQVISTGGGAFAQADGQAMLLAGGENLVVHLRIRPETVVARLQNSRSGRPRPLLDVPDPLQRITELMEQRRAAYGLAQVVLDVDDRSTYEVVAEIVRRWHAWRRRRKGWGLSPTRQRVVVGRPTGVSA